MNGEEPPFKRRQMLTFLMLPDDLVLNCLARISKLYYPTLSLVSKRFRSLLASTGLYQTRNFLGYTESYIYVCLQVQIGYFSYPLRWFILCRRPNSSKKILVPISSPDTPCTYRSSAAAVSSNIYAIGGLINRDDASSKVMVMDCISHTWREAPDMRVAREFPSSCVVDGKIYVTGGCKNPDSTNWIEVFDTKTQNWESLQIPSEEICKGSSYKSVGYEGTIYVKSKEKRATYKLHRGRWREADLALNRRWYGGSTSVCAVENVLYRCDCETIQWYDSKERSWTDLKGLLRSFTSLHKTNVRLVDCGGEITVLWEDIEILNGHRQKLIWCAEIALEIRDQEKREIWGMLKWSDVVFITKESNHLVHALATTL